MEPEGEGVNGSARRGRSDTVPGSTVRTTAGEVGAGEPTGVPADGSDTTVSPRAEGHPSQRSIRSDRGSDAQQESEVRDGIHAGDPVGRVGRSETVRGGVSENEIPGRSGGKDAGEPDRADAVVDSTPNGLALPIY